VPNLETKYKRSKIIFCVTGVAFIVVHICTERLQLPVYSLIGSPGTHRRVVLKCREFVSHDSGA